MRHFRIFILVIFLLGNNVLAKPGEIGLPFITNYSPAEYGANTQNWAAVQDLQGIMYFGNNRGVLQYDGTNWNLIPNANQSIIRSLAINSQGVVFVGGVGDFGYLTADSLGQMQYQSLTLLLNEEEQDFSDVWSTTVRDDEVFFQSFNRLFRYRNGKITSWALQNTYHRSFVINGEFYVRQHGVGLTVLENDSLVLVPGGEVFAENVISAMLPFNNGILIGSRNTGVQFYNVISGELSEFNAATNAILSEDQIYHGTQLPDGRFAFATIKNGLVVLERDGTISTRLTRESGLPYNTVYYLYTDRNNDLWAASAHGISRIEISSPFSVFNSLLGLDGGTLAMTRFNNRLYVSTHQGVYYLDTDNKFKQIEGLYAQSWQMLVYRNPVNYNDTHLLVASTGGLFKVIGNKVALVLEGRVGSLSTSVLDPNRIYIGLNGQVASLRFKNGEFVPEKVFNFHQDEIRSIQEDRKGNLWLGTMYNGLYRIKTNDWNQLVTTNQNPEISTLALNYGVNKGLPTPNWNYLHFTADRMLVTTQEGIYQYNYQTDKFTEEPILSAALNGDKRWFYYLKEDQEGNLWFDSNKGKGIFMQEGSGYRLVESQFKRIVVSPENQVAGFSEGNSVKWFGTPDGIFRYQPNLVGQGSNYIQTLIRKVIMNKDSVIYYGNKPDTQQPNKVLAGLAQSGTTTFKPQHNHITFQFTATSYQHKGSNIYSYVLEGYDEEWSTWTTSTTKEYTNLPPGNYTFKVRAKNFNETIGSTEAYRFSIAPPWYQTGWAYTGFFLSFIGVVIGAARVNSYRLKEQNRVLEHMVDSRTSELEKRSHELEKEKNKLELSYQNVTTLSQIGQKITATLDLKSIISTLYESTNSLVDFHSFGIGLYNEYTNTLDFVHAFENGNELPAFSQSLDDDSQLSVWCYRYKQDVIIGEFERDTLNYLKNLPQKPPAGHQFSESVMYVPLQVKEKVIGVLTLQSFHKNAYRSYQVDILRSLAAYTAIALDNSYAYIQLNEINEELNSTLENLRQTQGQLVQSEKMASLGQLTAGVAHEINNPINFVSAGIDSLSVNYSELNELLNLYKALKPNEDTFAKLSEIEKLKKELDLDYLLEEIPQLLKSVKSGAQRTTEIVRSLRNFTRLDEENLKQANLEEGLESTLVILRNKFKERIKINRQYSQISEISCYPGQLNQVFMNIISNAIQAIEGEGTITLKTEENAQNVTIYISDTGKGMPEEVKNRIFEPFYTTKEVGEGTGLGLSITYGIIEKHKGSIEVVSKAGEGTTFIIRLPKQG